MSPEETFPNFFFFFFGGGGGVRWLNVIKVWQRKAEELFLLWCASRVLSANVHKQIFLTDLHTFTYFISWENLLKDINNFLLVIIFLILVTFSVDYVLIL